MSEAEGLTGVPVCRSKSIRLAGSKAFQVLGFLRRNRTLPSDYRPLPLAYLFPDTSLGIRALSNSENWPLMRWPVSITSAWLIG